MMPQDHPFEALPEARPWLDRGTAKELVLSGPLGVARIPVGSQVISWETVSQVTGIPVDELIANSER